MEHLNKGQTAMSPNFVSQHVSCTSNQASQTDLVPGFHNTMPVNWALQQWPSIPVNLGSDQSLSMNNQSIQTNLTHRLQVPLPVILNHDPSSCSNIVSLGAQAQLNIHSSPSTSLSSPSTSKNKRPAQVHPPTKVQNVVANNPGMQQLPLSNKRPAPSQPLQKVQSEAIESVRSKLRESLAALLAMVPEQGKQQQVEEKLTAEDSGDVAGEIELRAVDSSCITSSADEVSSEHAKKCDVTKRESGLVESRPKHASPDVDMAADSPVVKDDLLQGHGLYWASDPDTQGTETPTNHGAKRLKVVHAQATSDENKATTQKVEYLAFQIESELFKLFGGVTKKYKEKGRSLLFNLKDRNNPELRERVFAGEIAPEHLCTMTAEELASKELSEWRLAKAEEFAQMVVLPDSEDVRRLVKKTHKGEFQVELEQTDTVSVEVGLGTSVVPQFQSKVKEPRMQSKYTIKNNNHKASDRLLPADNGEFSEQNLSSNIGNLLQEKTDLIEELMEDDVKNPELLPPIVSLDEFMQALDSEPPFENLPVDSVHETPSSVTENEETLESKAMPKSNSPLPESNSISESKRGSSNQGLESKLDPSRDLKSETASASPTGQSAKSPAGLVITSSRAVNEVKPVFSQAHSNTVASEAPNENIWEGSIQLTISSLARVFGMFKSGERTSTQDWPNFLEIKGRVRLDAFEKFLQDLPLSRSRAVMIAQFHWKQGTSESGPANLQEIIDSYIADERVGFAEPAEGVELYFCPPNQRTTELIRKCLPKDKADTLELVADALVGVTVWRRLQSTISPRSSSHHKHGNSTRRQFSTRKLPGIDTNSTTSSASLPSPTPPTAPAVQPPDDDDDIDVPPGFGPKVDDDLPEFDFVRGSSHNSKQPFTSQQSGFPLNRTHVSPPGRPVDQIRQLIHKYGQSESSKIPYSNVHRWNNDDDDDDIPEWQPNGQLPQAPPPPSGNVPSQYPSYLQQPNIHPRPFQSNHQKHPNQLLPCSPAPPPSEQFVPYQLSSLHPRAGMIPGPVNVQQPLQRNEPWLHRGPTETNANTGNMVRPSYYNPHQGNGQQSYDVGILHNGMTRRPHVFTSRGL